MFCEMFVGYLLHLLDIYHMKLSSFSIHFLVFSWDFLNTDLDIFSFRLGSSLRVTFRCRTSCMYSYRENSNTSQKRMPQSLSSTGRITFHLIIFAPVTDALCRSPTMNLRHMSVTKNIAMFIFYYSTYI